MYHYESLGDERFQEFCQALISTSFPNAQCLPVGQPDGGRDAFVLRRLVTHNLARPAPDLVVFQVKYAKTGAETRDERDMIEAVIKSEKAKVEKLKAAGLTKYYLLTNVKGTSHPDSGSIDKVNDTLTRELGIESYCWWRDDLDRRLDGNSSIKWSYPEVLKATDLLQALIEGHLGEDEARRKGAIRAYMTAQYDEEQELKFKQTDLRSTMVDLFVDLPMRRSVEISDAEVPNLRITRGGRYFQSGLGNFIYEPDEGQSSAEYFIKDDSQNDLRKVVLEGAPGQGKSTVTQFICQVLRMRLLGKANDLASIPPQFSEGSVRIPFRVDLRDLAKWISGVDPFQSKPTGLDEREPRSLEGFLAGQVRFMSGGHEFTVSDLSAVARASHLLLALDGFDEVADVQLRQQLVAEITKGSTRLVSAGSFSVQTIVTSRPAAFAKSVRFPRDQWAYFELLPLERKQVDAYAAKWMKAKGVKETERQKLSRTLEAKLQEPHTQFLAKNPMQLTILLSLIYNRGASLPEKRTAMYDAYMDLFFSRESEKSDIVRDNRDLLIDIHRYLAWKLQTSAETGGNGSIERASLRRVLLLYLDSQKEDTGIVDELFDGIIERVGALVSRVQETYEFEVQPLREYFAARHLYDTAPYSPAGDERSGTKLDRFDALVKNPYWLNVARFYGGCFSKGEISALVDELIELASSGSYSFTSHPRNIALMLLCDWVFTQYQPAVKRIVSFIGELPQLRQLLANAEQAGASGWSTLPDRSGRTEFLEILWQRVVAAPQNDERQALASAIMRNSPIVERASRWESLMTDMPELEWLRLGRMLNIFQGESPTLPKMLCSGGNEALVSALVEAERFTLIEAAGCSDLAMRAMLHGLRNLGHPRAEQQINRLALIWSVFGLNQYIVGLNDDSGAPLRHSVERRYGIGKPSRKVVSQTRDLIAALPEAEQAILRAHDAFLSTPTTDLSSSLAPWSELVEALRRAWGDSAAVDRIAFLAAGVRSKEVVEKVDGLLQAERLVEAARYIRLKSGAPRWWREALDSSPDEVERRRLLLLLWMWGTPKTIIKIMDSIGSALNKLSDKSWTNLYRDYYFLSGRLRDDGFVSVNDKELSRIQTLGPRLCAFIGLRIGGKQRDKLGIHIANIEEAKGIPETQFAMDIVLAAPHKADGWRQNLPKIQSLYERGAFSRYGLLNNVEIDRESALAVSAYPERYPLSLVSLADNYLRSTVGAEAGSLLDVANREKWFPE